MNMEDGAPTSPVETKGTKAIIATVGAALTAGITSAITALSDNQITQSEWLTIALAVIVGSGITGAVTYRVPNQPK